MTLLPLLCLIAGVLLVLVLLGGSLGRFIGRCSGWPVAGFEAYPMAGRRALGAGPGRWTQQTLYTPVVSGIPPTRGGV